MNLLISEQNIKSKKMSEFGQKQAFHLVYTYGRATCGLTEMHNSTFVSK